MIGIALLFVFFVFAALMYVRILPAILAVPAMALALGAISGASPAQIGGAMVAGSTLLSKVFVTVIFGALLSRVTLSTGIAETIVTYAAEFGGDRPFALALALAAAVALLFTSLSGLGAIIMVGSIVLPIMMTIGVPRRLAATIFLLAYALGFIFNIAQWTFYTQTFGVAQPAMREYALVLGTIDLVALLAFAVVRFRASRGYATWALALEDDAIPKRRVNAAALVTPVIPLVLYYLLGIDALLGFALAAIYGVLTTRPRQAIATLVASAIRGVEDVAPAILLFIGIGTLLAITALPQTRAALGPLVAAIAPRNRIAYVVVFGLLSPLALFRGPLNPFGVGIAVYTVLAGLHVLPPVVLVAAVMAVSQVQNACDPTNTQNVWVANFTGVRVDEIALLTVPYQVAVATAATLAVVLFAPGLFGVAPFVSPATPAAAAVLSLDPNVKAVPVASPTATATPLLAPSPAPTVARFGAALLAPPTAARRVAVVASGDSLASDAADEIARAIERGWPGFRVERVDARAIAPNGVASDCSTKSYVAVFAVSIDARERGSDAEAAPNERVLDAGLTLHDCSDWPVDQWYESRTVESSSTLEGRRLGLALLDRARLWMREHPGLAQTLFARGLALDSTQVRGTYLYSLFKTSDGQMRAYVRPGGPAYDAGLRTNDIVDKLDGKYWWEYGTFQTQARAYDGKPHEFEITRSGRAYDVRLGAALSPSSVRVDTSP